MRIRGLLIAAILMVALGVGVWFSNRAEKAKEGKSATSVDAPKILAIPEDQIQKIEIAKKDGETTVVQRDAGNKWRIVQPKPLPADQDSVTSIATTLASLASDRLVEDKAADIAQYGLNAPGLTVTVTKKDGKSEKLLIGDDTPTGSGAFAKLEGDPRVFTLASYNKSSVDKTAKDLRDKRLLTFDSDKLTRVELIRKGQTVEFGKNNKNEWSILKPKPYRADGGQVEEFVRKLKDAKMDPAASDEDMKKAAASFAAATPIAVARATDANGTQQIEVRKDKENNYWARSSVVEGVYKSTSELGDALDKDVDAFRARKVFEFGWNDPTKVEVKGGTKVYAFQKSGDKWTDASGKQVDSTSVQNLIDKLRDLSASRFAETGFTTPVVEITVVSNGGKTTEHASLAIMGNGWLAKRDNDPTLYQLDGNAGAAIPQAAADVKAPAPAAAKK